ncbi:MULTISPECIES: hypothetical protein [unclassified Microcoleus]|uniref:hypothetical protein n=1 Tax=unclassified Microcoleus TaxID=2642155 RepID=UPI002FD5112F
MSSPVQNITSPLLTCSDNLRAAAQCSGLEEIFDRSLSREDIASPSAAWTVAFKRSLRARRTCLGHFRSWDRAQCHRGLFCALTPNDISKYSPYNAGAGRN